MAAPWGMVRPTLELTIVERHFFVRDTRRDRDAKSCGPTVKLSPMM